MFSFISTIDNLSNQLNNAPLYKYRLLKIDEVEYWLQYQRIYPNEEITYTLNGIIAGMSATQIIKPNDDGTYSVYRYNGSLTITRHIKNNIIDDVIENIVELETNIKNHFNQMR